MLKKLKAIALFSSLALSCVASPDKTKPEGAIQFIAKDGVHQMVNENSPKDPLKWEFKDGVLTATKGHIVTAMPVTNFKAHLEFNVNDRPGNPGNNGNSGVYIQQRYEIQILNSFNRNKEDYKTTDCASIYKFKTPDKIVCKPHGEWQSYDIEFYAAKWDGDKKIANARITLYHNGVLVHDNVEIPEQTGRGKLETPEAFPLRLQHHGNAVKFRNFWLKELK